MSILETIKNRGTIRKYLPKSIPKEEMSKIMESARLAQSAANRQPWQFILVSEPSIKKKLSVAARNQSSVNDASSVVVCLADPLQAARVGPFEGFLVDLSIAIENMALTSWELGIGSCWIGAYDEKEVKRLLGIPEDIRVVSLLTLGYPDEKTKTKARKPMADLLHYEAYGRTKV